MDPINNQNTNMFGHFWRRISIVFVLYLSYFIFRLRRLLGYNDPNPLLENQISPKSIMNDMLENLAGEDHKLINANETVEQTFMRLINNKEYDLAMRLAKKFDLDTDLIYKNMWQYNQKTIPLIEECLNKITQPLWILNECVNCVPRELDVLKHLLKFGINVSEKYSDTKRFFEEEDKVKQFERLKENLKDYLKKLELYEQILQAKYSNDDVDNSGDWKMHFDWQYYQTIRRQSLFQLSINFAHQADIQSLFVLFQKESKTLAKHFLVILSNLPETLSPNDYRHLIDFVIDFLLLNLEKFENRPTSASAMSGDEFETDFYSNHVYYCRFKVDSTIDQQKIVSWFDSRAREIIDHTSLVDNSLELLRIGIQKGFVQLQDLYAELDLYSLLIYESYNKSAEVTFENFEKLTINEKMNLFLSNKNNIVLFGSLFEKFFEKINDYGHLEKFNVSKTDMLKSFFRHLAKVNFEQCLKIFEMYTMVNKTIEEIKSFKVINDPCELMDLALECILSYENPQQIDIAFKILECLPETQQVEDLLDIYEKRDDYHKLKQLIQRNEMIDEIEYRLSILELLEQYNSPMTVKELWNVEHGDKTEMLAFLEKVINNFCKQKLTKNVLDDWKLFFINLKDLTQRYLKLVNSEELVETAIKCLLLSSKKDLVQIAFNHIDWDSKMFNKKLPEKRAKAILTKVAEDYVKFADPSVDDNLELAKICLKFIQAHEPNEQDVNEELNFIEAMEILNEEFELKVMPIKLRCMSDTEILDTILTSSNDAHFKVEKILKICSLLKIFENCGQDPDERESQLLNLIGHQALKHGDYAVAIDLCKDIMQRNLKSGWKLCYEICLLKDLDQFLNVDQQLWTLSFVLANCPENDINMHYELLNTVKQIKTAHINHITEQKVFINFRGVPNSTITTNGQPSSDAVAQ